MPAMLGTLVDAESRAIVRRTLDYYIERHPDMAAACQELRDVLLGTIDSDTRSEKKTPMSVGVGLAN
jgi:hypothetical protein